MKFSIIIPVYNAAKYLRPCLDSVLAQTCPEWECICVDDGSTDEGGRILDEYAARDARFKVIHQQNGGEGVARNMGLKAASGEWITWLDADDLYAPDRLEEAKRIIEKENPDLVRFRTYTGRESDVGFGPDKTECYAYRVIEGDAAKKWGWNVLTPAGMVWTWVARRELLDGMSFVPGMRVKVDSIFSGSLSNRLNRIIQSAYQAYFYRYIASSAIHSVRKADDCLRLLKAVKNLFLGQKDIRQTLGNELYNVMIRRLRMHCECDIIDWALMRQGELERKKEIYSVYLELKKTGVFDCASIQQRRYRMPMWWWDKTGQIWMIEVVGELIRGLRKIR